MSIFWNMDPSVLRVGGRKAPQLTMEQFKKIFDAAIPRCEEDNFRGNTMQTRLCDAIHSDFDESIIEKALKDLRKIDVSFENVEFVEYRMGANGVPYAWLFFGGDWEVPVYGMLYWDGKDIRGYLPTYGNMFNAHQKAAFGSDGFFAGPYTYEEDGKLFTESFHSEEDWMGFLRENFYMGETGKVNDAACDKDFSSRVIATGAASDKDVEKAMAKLQKRVQKWAEMEEED